MVKFTQELFDEICESIADGISLRDICLADDMPSKSTVFKWLSQDERLADQYARAREVQADVYFDAVVSIADKATSETVQESRLKIDARKWAAGKLKPKKYGDKLDLTSTDGSMTPKPTVIELVAPGANDDSAD